MTNEGIMIRINVNDISVIGRNTSGVKLMNVDRENGVRITGFSKMNAAREEEQEEEEETENEEP